MYTTIATIALKILGSWITKRTADKEAEKKFIELAQHLQAKKLISANIKWGRMDNLTELERKRQEAKKRNEEAK